MSTLRIILGPSGSGKSRTLYKNVIERAEKNPGKNYIVIVPEQVSHSVTDALIAMSERKGIMNIDVLSFPRLAHRIFDNAGGNTTDIIDDTGKNLILKGIIREQEENLTVLKKNIKRIGYISEIKSIISEFVQYEISPEDVLEYAGRTDKKYLSKKLKDIAVLYRAFRERTAEKYVTREELLDRASDAADRALFLKGAEIFLDDFTGFTPIQYRFLTALFDHVSEVSLCLDYDGKDGELFALSVNTIEKMRKIASDALFKTETVHLYEAEQGRFKDNPALARLERNLFRRDLKNKGELKDKEEENNGDEIRIIRAPAPDKEVSFIVSEILSLIKKGYRYRDIGIVMSDPENYGRLFKAEADREGLPLFIDATTELLLNPYTEFIRSALNAVSENMSYESVFHFIRSGLTDITPEEADILENYVRALNIRGRKKYGSRFVLHIKTMADEDELTVINKAREKLLAILSPLMEAVSGREKSAGYYTGELRKFIDSSGIKERIAGLSKELKDKGDLRNAGIYEQIPKKTEELFKKIENLIPDERMKFSEYAELLDAGFEAVKVGALPPGLDALKAGDMERSRLSNIKVLFFAGLNDGIIPAANSGKGLLSDHDREEIKERGMELSPTARERIALQKLYFYMNVTKPSERLYLTYSMENGEGGSLNPSFFLGIVRDILTGLKTETYTAKEIREKRKTASGYLESFARNVRNEDEKERSRELYSCFSQNRELKSKADRILDHAFRIRGNDPVSKAVLSVLYGDRDFVSPSRLEKFAECAYRHFMLYGLKAMEREEFGFERRDLGNVLHGVLNLCSEILYKKKLRYADLNDEEIHSLVTEAMSAYLKAHENVVLMSSERNKHLVSRIERILLTTVNALKNQSGKGAFKPELFEKDFESGGFKGRIDRVDTAGEDNVVYVSVIDYKSGNKAFDLSKVYYGLDLQLVIYMNGAMELMRLSHPGKEIRPAGLFYYHIDDPLIKEEELKSATDDEINTKIMDSLKLRGIVNSEERVIRLFDRDFEKKSSVVPVAFSKEGTFTSTSSVASTEEFKVISDYVQKKAADTIRRIEEGEYAPEPAVFNNNSPCDYCAFSDCCRFDKETPGFKERKLLKIKDKSEIIEKMRED